MRKYTNKELDFLCNNSYKIREDSLQIEVKESGKRKGTGYADPFEVYCLNRKQLSEEIGVPDTVIATAEYDGLRLQGELYARKLLEAGNQVEVIRYAGTFHAFFDRLGYVPQAEAVCTDIVERLNR